MAAPLSQDLRRRLVQAVEQGSSAREAARRFAVSESAAIKLVRRVREAGSTEPARIGGPRKPLLAGHEELLRALTTTKPGIALAEIKAKLAARGIEAGCPTTIWSTLRRLGLLHKKAARGLPSSRKRGAFAAGTGRMWPPTASFGDPGNASWTRGASCSSMKPAPART